MNDESRMKVRESDQRNGTEEMETTRVEEEEEGKLINSPRVELV